MHRLSQSLSKGRYRAARAAESYRIRIGRDVDVEDKRIEGEATRTGGSRGNELFPAAGRMTNRGGRGEGGICLLILSTFNMPSIASQLLLQKYQDVHVDSTLKNSRQGRRRRMTYMRGEGVIVSQFYQCKTCSLQ